MKTRMHSKKEYTQEDFNRDRETTCNASFSSEFWSKRTKEAVKRFHKNKNNFNLNSRTMPPSTIK